MFVKLMRLVLIITVGALSACQTARTPLVIDFKWFESEPAYAWLTDCIGEEALKAGDTFEGQFTIVDGKTAKRLASLEPGESLTEEDLAGLRCKTEP